MQLAYGPFNQALALSRLLQVRTIPPLAVRPWVDPRTQVACAHAEPASIWHGISPGAAARARSRASELPRWKT